MNDWYILDENKKPVPASIYQWSEWSTVAGNKIVEQTYFGNVKVSTVFLGLDHSFWGGNPVLFETMIFDGVHDQYQERYETYDDAVKGHWNACDLVIKSIEKYSKFKK